MCSVEKGGSDCKAAFGSCGCAGRRWTQLGCRGAWTWTRLRTIGCKQPDVCDAGGNAAAGPEGVHKTALRKRDDQGRPARGKVPYVSEAVRKAPPSWVLGPEVDLKTARKRSGGKAPKAVGRSGARLEAVGRQLTDPLPSENGYIGYW